MSTTSVCVLSVYPFETCALEEAKKRKGKLSLSWYLRACSLDVFSVPNLFFKGVYSTLNLHSHVQVQNTERTFQITKF